MLNPYHSRKTLFGTKMWFTTKPMLPIAEKEISAFIRDNKCKDEEQITSEDIKFTYNAYRSVKGEAIGYLYRKNERLSLKDTLIANITDEYRKALKTKDIVFKKHENASESIEMFHRNHIKIQLL